jgi:hypothetical protein
MSLNFFSPAQCVGYVVLILGIAAYTQKIDKRLKALDAMQNVAYIVHFLLLGNAGAAVSAGLSCACSITAMRVRSTRLALAFIAANLVMGFAFCAHYYEMLSSVGAGLVAWAMFTMKGMPMRVVILFATLCWLANDLFCGSIGGTALEVVIGVANISTIVRLCIQGKSAKAQ